MPHRKRSLRGRQLRIFNKAHQKRIPVIRDIRHGKTWKIDSCEVFSVSTDRGKGHLGADIYPRVTIAADGSVRSICPPERSSHRCSTAACGEAANDQLLLETGGTYQLCDLNGSLTDVSIPHTGHVLAVDDQGYVLASTRSPELCGPIAAQCRTRSISTRCWGRILPS